MIHGDSFSPKSIYELIEHHVINSSFKVLVISFLGSTDNLSEILSSQNKISQIVF